jgi:hypothetical protein
MSSSPLFMVPLLGVGSVMHLLWIGLAVGRDGNPMRADVELYAGKTGGSSTAEVSLRLDAPGGVRGWAIRRGSCDRPGAVFGDPAAYPALRVDRTGKAAGKAAIAVAVPDTGAYHVVVTVSPTDRQRVLACGDLVLED